VTAALRLCIGRICHIYLDDIIIWSKSVENHKRDIHEVLSALWANKLYCNPDKSKFFRLEVDFLGHHISAQEIEADEHKAQRILDWPKPKSISEVRAFCGLMRYLASFLPAIAEHTRVLTELTKKSDTKRLPAWEEKHQKAFDSIKKLVAGRGCLTSIDYDLMPDYKFFVTTDASDFQCGATLTFRKTWETVRPVAFNSQAFKGVQLNYPVHEKELLAVVRVLTKWCGDLLGIPFKIYTDHKMLENFLFQKDLSRRQARWMELLAQFDAHFVYIKGEKNSVADALS
jgi:hypothetical protein